MSKKLNALLLYPHQLYEVSLLPKDLDEVILVEDPWFFGTDPTNRVYFHKQKLIFHRACMRRYVEEELWPAGYKVDYIEFQHLTESGDIVEKLKEFENVAIFEMNDDILRRRVMSAISESPEPPNIAILENPSFFLTATEVDNFFTGRKNTDFLSFYQWQRERFNILIDSESYKPLEGKWKDDTAHRKRLPVNHELPSFQVYGSNKHVSDAVNYINHHFSENPGTIPDFPWPTSRGEAREWLKEFLSGRLKNFNQYQDSIDGHSAWVYHSGLSSMLNNGLLTPQIVVTEALDSSQKNDVLIADLESFIRQILGWREYVRGVYRKKNVALRTSNSYDHKRRMTADWYNGTTGIMPVDDVINKVRSRSYAHHVERLMIVGNIMFLCEFHPDDVYRWFLEMFIDSYDWVLVPNVYGISQNSDSEDLSGKPAISSSNYILNMSHYEKDDWCDIWDGLYWSCIEKNRERFANNPSMAMAVKQLDKLNSDRKRVISYRAEDFLKSKTVS